MATKDDDDLDDTRAEVVTATESDVYLDVPQVDVEELNLDVQDLRARVSLSVEVLDLLKLDVGADVALGSVHLDLKGVHAQALLKVRLDHVAEIVGRVLETVDRNPEILEQALSAVERTFKPVTTGSARALEATGTGAAAAIDRTAAGLGDTVARTADGLAGTVEAVPGITERVSAGGKLVDEIAASKKPAKKAAKKTAKKRR